MALIKSANSDRMLKQAVVLDLGDLGRQGQRILQAARDEAAQIIHDARTQAKQLIEDAQGRGHLEGVERGTAEGREIGRREGREQLMAELRPQLDQVQKNWIATLEKWEQDRRDLFDDAREDVVRFALALAGKVVHRMIESDPTIVQTQVEQAMRLVSRPSAIEITINPEDRPLVEEVLPQIIAPIDTCSHAGIREDAAMQRGGCVITVANGRVDASIETQLDRIAEAILPSTSTASITESQPQAGSNDGLDS